MATVNNYRHVIVLRKQLTLNAESIQLSKVTGMRFRLADCKMATFRSRADTQVVSKWRMRRVVCVGGITNLVHTFVWHSTAFMGGANVRLSACAELAAITVRTRGS